MKHLLIAGLVALAAVAGQATAAPSDGTVVRRTTLVVNDLDASIAFYRTLGFELWYDGKGGTVTGQGLPVDGTKVGDPTRLVIMKGKDPYIGMVGLLQYGPKRPLPKLDGRMQVGQSILMIETKGIAAITEKLKAIGARIHKGPDTSHIKSVSDEWDATFLMVFDPDGRMIELTERLN